MRSLLLLASLPLLAQPAMLMVAEAGIRLASPTFSPAPGSYGPTQMVTLSGPAGAVLCYNASGSATATTAGTCDQSTYSTAITVSSTTTISALTTEVGHGNSLPVNGLYTITGAASSWVTFTVGSLRNNLSGWVGEELTVGSSPISVLGLGRPCISGNSQTHTLYLSTTAGGSGGVVLGPLTVNLSGCTAGTFVEATGTATLSASTVYVCWSSETNGGDNWYDSQVVPVDSSAALTLSVYNLTPGNPPGVPGAGAAGQAYVPCTFYH